MKEKNRKSVNEILSELSWGTHLCQFYHTKEDLLDILVPYFKAGLENNEFCMWVTSEPLSKKEAEKEMRKAVPYFTRYLKSGQIEIVPYEDWYFRDGNFNLKRVLNAWVDKSNQAITEGYEGMRATVNTAWLEKRDWNSFTEYEEEINRIIDSYRMIVICFYSLDRCGALEILDVVKNHQIVLIRREWEWECFENFIPKR